ncbi:efflux RND transporter periplasmic adaptor subunit [Collinsella sp. TF10-11AT]|uniref:efflux RND transporter periplasmic adaptor subunit n=1 Tax=unclassified Collinsella TaxID=2637548 RepID=UPI000E43A113|nr:MULTISPECIES: efflux RND transporter periplasmic adaptor subunit [unclassified Collinsella]RGK63418.1 efflux RND transporter periplasmic adaptor subunit [Collinsella sp. TF10-11AT]RHB13191.1 efflux RND transporter periplasmic adaptor subunit [Collinsella sp. AM41-2BH]RHL06852.1 efflux RND transporter periplasmic adaptor subunit [Collinsella sp. AF39-11AT]
MSKVPTINPGPDDSDRMPQDATETLPIISAADTKQPQTSLDDSTDISDEEAYAKLKAKRAERRRKKLIRRGIAVGVVVAIALIAIIATLVINAQPAGTNGPVTDMVTEGTFTTTVEAKGQLKPISASVVSPSVDGTVEKINMQAGQSVNEGDVLMTIKNDALDSAVSEAQRAVAAAQEDLNNAKVALAAAQAAPTTDSDGSTGPSDANANANAVSTAQRNLASAQAALEQATAKAAERTVKAPSSGSIVELNAKVGATVTGGMIMGESDTSGGKQCMQIADLSKMKVTVQVGEKDIAKIAVGQSANVTYPAFPDIVSQGTVTAIASVANSDSNSGGGSVTFNVDILIEAPDSRLKPGMTAEVSVVTEKLDDVVMVPTMALMTEDGEHYYVNLATDSEGKKTRRVKVTVVTQNDNEAVVGKTQVKRDDQGNEINPDVPVTKLRDGDTIVTDTGTGMTADGGDNMSADEGK